MRGECGNSPNPKITEEYPMEYKLTILGRLDALNDYTAANRRNYHVGGDMKKDNENIIIWAIRNQLKNLHILNPVIIHYEFFEKDRRRDNDNILSCAAKFVQDSLVKTKVLQNDNQKCIHRFWFDTYIDQKNPRVEVTIIEITKEQTKLNLRDLLKQLEVGD